MTDRHDVFPLLLERIRDIAAGPDEPEAKLLAVCQLLADEIEHYDWVGFYVADAARRDLTLGPYVGDATDHTRILFGEGICGQAAQREETFVVQDVSKESNYLSCGIKVKSEIVVPVFKGARVAAEIDIDSHAPAPFTDADREFLERVAATVSGLFPLPGTSEG